MKSSYPRAIAMLAVTLALAACGGKESFVVGGTLSGVSDNDLVLSNNGDTVRPKKDDTTFSFPQKIDYGTAYNITVNDPLHMTCSVSGGSGSAGHFTSISATVTCARKRYALSGTVTGLKPNNTLQLTNGTVGSISVKAADTKDIAFTFGPVDDGAPYSVKVLAVLPAPAQTCTINDDVATGVMGTKAVENIKVTCI